MKLSKLTILLSSASLLMSVNVFAGHHGGKMLSTNLMGLDSEKSIGSVTFKDTAYGLEITPNLSGLTPGLHGFHIHENPNCGESMKDGQRVLGGAAGSHYDPEKTGKHGLPWSQNSHLGDLPALYVSQDGEAYSPVLAPRLKYADIKNRSIMVHAHGDNYSDDPKPLGGGGSRVACGVINADK
jgi:Cu-Zn family superoxide dismutase